MSEYDKTPQSRVEKIIKAGVDGETYDKPAQSRVEYLLKELINGGGGGGGTGDYNDLINKPTINDRTVQGNLTSDDLDVAPEPRVIDETLII